MGLFTPSKGDLKDNIFGLNRAVESLNKENNDLRAEIQRLTSDSARTGESTVEVRSTVDISGVEIGDVVQANYGDPECYKISGVFVSDDGDVVLFTTEGTYLQTKDVAKIFKPKATVVKRRAKR